MIWRPLAAEGDWMKLVCNSPLSSVIVFKTFRWAWNPARSCCLRPDIKTHCKSSLWTYSVSVTLLGRVQSFTVRLQWHMCNYGSYCSCETQQQNVFVTVSTMHLSTKKNSLEKIKGDLMLWRLSPGCVTVYEGILCMDHRACTGSGSIRNGRILKMR